jgi:putative transposase
MTEQNP